MVIVQVSDKIQPALTAAEMLQAGLECHRHGQLAEAGQYYRRVLENDGGHSDALHLLGLVASEQGDHPEAVRLIRGAIANCPGTAVYQANLGLALSRNGQLEEAIDAYGRAVTLEPTHAVTLAKLGRVLAAAGRTAEAREKISRAMALDPSNPDTHNALGAVEAQTGDWDTARRCFEEALRLDPGYEEAHTNLLNALNLAGESHFAGQRWSEAEQAYRSAMVLEPLLARHRYNLAVCLTAQRKIPDALRCYEQSLLLAPDNAQAFNNVGLLHQASGEPAPALACYGRALELMPDYPDARYNMAVLLAELERYQEARAAYAEVLRLDPGHADSHNNLGGLCLAENRPEASLAHYRQALRHNSQHEEARWNMALAQLSLGDWDSGWKGYEERLRQKNFPAREFTQPRWTGENRSGETILVWAEQGLGDTIQFARYLPLLQARGLDVVFECPPRLAPLLRRLEGSGAVIAKGEPAAGFACHTPLLSLPGLLETTLDNIPPPAGPWHLPAAKQEKWRRELEGYKGKKVGLCWAGSIENHNGRKRSAPLSALLPALKVEGLHWFSLQRGPQSAELASGMEIVNLERDENDILDTAAIVSQLDLVVSVDTMTAHLAGSLCTPVWTLLPFAADWRWMLDRLDTPWYPCMKLFRQQRNCGWDGLSVTLKAALEGWVSQ